MRQTTLLLLVKGTPKTHVLLGYKKTGFGKGKFTGIGGKVEKNETVREAAIREMFEETQISVEEAHLTPTGTISFRFPAKTEWDLNIHVFLAQKWSGSPIESEEIRPQWFHIKNLPFQNMWDDAKYWYPKVLAGAQIDAHFVFKSDNETVAKHQIQTLSR